MSPRYQKKWTCKQCQFHNPQQIQCRTDEYCAKWLTMLQCWQQMSLILTLAALVSQLKGISYHIQVFSIPPNQPISIWQIRLPQDNLFDSMLSAKSFKHSLNANFMRMRIIWSVTCLYTLKRLRTHSPIEQSITIETLQATRQPVHIYKPINYQSRKKND